MGLTLCLVGGRSENLENKGEGRDLLSETVLDAFNIQQKRRKT